MSDLKRREFLKASAAFAAASAAGGFGCSEIASAAPIQVPTIDKLTMRVLIDQAHYQFLRGSTVNVATSRERGMSPSSRACLSRLSDAGSVRSASLSSAILRSVALVQAALFQMLREHDREPSRMPT